MSILDSVTHSSVRTGIRVVIAAVEKVGKTTLTCDMPRALLVPLEAGFATMNVNKTPMLESYGAIMQLLDEIIVQAQAGTFPYQTIVFDSVTAMERMIHDRIIQTDPTYLPGNPKALTMESALGGYGKAYQHANSLFAQVLAKCDLLAVNAGINIAFTCHVFSAEIQDPTAGVYNSWDLLLHSPKNQKTYGKREMMTQWADLIGFMHEPIFVTEGKVMNKAVSGGQGRMLATTRAPGYVAGNRFKMTNIIAIPAVQGWNQIAQEIYQASGLDYYNHDQLAAAPAAAAPAATFSL